MPKVNYNWVAEQLNAAHVSVLEGETALALLKVWENISPEDPAVGKSILELFTTLAQGHVVVTENPDEEEIWIDVTPGQIVVTDEVRVKADAYDGELGPIHNGRRGKVIAVRYGDIIFRSTDDREPLLDGVHYSPYKMEKRVR